MTFNRKLALGLAFGSLMISQVGQAALYVQESFGIETATTNSGSITSASIADTKGTELNFRGTAGITFAGGVLLGAAANLSTTSAKSEGTTTTSEGDVNGSEFGPAIGFTNGGFHLIGAYLLLGSKTTKMKTTVVGIPFTDTETKLTKPSGFQLDMGYTFAIAPTLRIGPSLVYRQLKFAKQSFTNNLNAAENYTDSDLQTKAKLNGLIAVITIALSL